MHVLLVNGSCHAQGCTYTALRQVADILEEEGVTTEFFQLGSDPVRDCIACHGCRRNGEKGNCVFDDDCVNDLIDKGAQADGFVFGTPVYFAHPTGQLLSVLDRALYTPAGKANFSNKPGFALVSARRAGTTAALEVMGKYLNIMPVVPSTYWPMVHGSTPADVLKDEEGLQTMRNAARNMVWMLRCIEAGKAQGILPPLAERNHRTNFIR